MAKFCVIPGIGGAPDSEYIMGTYPGAEAECISSGGHVVEHGTGGECGTTTSAASGSGAGRSAPLAAAVVGPIRALRSQLPESDITRDLERVNYSPELLRLLAEDDEVATRLRDAVGMVSQFALLALVDPQAETLRRSHYTQDLHGWLVELADLVRERADDEELRAAVDRLVGAFEQRVGQPIGTMAETMRADGPSTSA